MEAQDVVVVNYDRMKEVKAFEESKVGVKGLLDSGLTSIPKIFLHSPESLSDLPKDRNSQSPISIPVIDLAGVNSPSERPKIVDQLRDAARTWGFFQVINHGIPLSVQNDTVSAAKAFFDLPAEVKAQHYGRVTATRGVAYSSNTDLFSASAASWLDSLQVRLPETDEEEALVPEICRSELVAWFSHAADVAEEVMELLSEGLGLERGKLNELMSSGSRTLITHCYPYCPEPDRTMGIASHTDNSALTVLMQNSIPGLQMKYDGAWVDVKPETGGLIINVGDFFQIASNGEYKSVQHRVLANNCKESRVSVNVVFNIMNMKGDAHFGPLPELLSPEKPAIYRNFTKEEFREFMTGKGHALGNWRIVERVKI